MLRRIAATAVLFLPLPALACPAAADLDAGIRLMDTSGGTEVFRRLNADVVEALYTDADGIISRTQLGRGVYLLEYVEIEDGAIVPNSRETYAFAMTPGQMPLPQANTEWSTNVIYRTAFDMTPEKQIYKVGRLRDVQIGACSYASMQITIGYDPSPENAVETIQYLPELGFSYLVEFRDDQGVDRYRFSRIDAVGN